MHANQIKRLLGIFELTKNEQRVVLIVTLILIAIAFVGYERRVHRNRVQQTSVTEAKPSPTPFEIEDER
jgi:hypothetical protein